QRISVVSSHPVTRHEFRYVSRLSHTHGFLVESVSGDGVLATCAGAGLELLEMLLHVLKRGVDYPVALSAILEGDDRMSFMNDEWMWFANIHDDGVRMFLDTIIEFSTVTHFSLLSLTWMFARSVSAQPPPVSAPGPRLAPAAGDRS